MSELVYKDLSFEKDKGKIKVNFLRLFYSYLEESSLNKIAPFELNKNSFAEKL